MISVWQKICFVLRHKLSITYPTRRLYWQLQGAVIGKKTRLSAGHIAWPHNLHIGNDCIIEPHVFFKFDGPYTPGKKIIVGNHVFVGTGVEFNIKERIRIGDNCLIASGTRFIDHDHGTALGQLMKKQDCPTEAIYIGNDVWIGCNAVILKGVTINNGAVVAAGAVINQNIPSNEIWGGIPGRKIGQRS